MRLTSFGKAAALVLSAAILAAMMTPAFGAAVLSSPQGPERRPVPPRPDAGLFQVMVTGEDGPMAGVSVRIWDGRETLDGVTDERGICSFPDVRPDVPLTFRISPRSGGGVRLEDIVLPRGMPSSVSVQFVETRVGADFVVRLGSNPSTGYSWKIADFGDQAIVRLEGNFFSDSQTGSRRMAGRGGSDVWVFSTVQRGYAILTFEYARSWEKGNYPLRRHFAVVRVR